MERAEPLVPGRCSSVSEENFQKFSDIMESPHIGMDTTQLGSIDVVGYNRPATEPGLRR
jgi:hypothetical protein